VAVTAIGTEQVYEVWREANQEVNRRFGGSMRWVHRTRLQALWHPFTPADKSDADLPAHW